MKREKAIKLEEMMDTMLQETTKTLIKYANYAKEFDGVVNMDPVIVAAANLVHEVDDSYTNFNEHMAADEIET